MNARRFVGAVIAVFVVRTLMNMLFYGYAMQGRLEEISAAHTGMFREVVPAFIILDLITACFLTYLIVKAGSAFGGGIGGGVKVAILIAILGPVLGSLYYFFSVTYYSMDFFAIESVYQIVAYALQGAVAAAIYKTA